MEKGDTYEEYFGKERAKEIKLLQSKNNKRVNQGVTWEEKYGVKRAQEKKDRISKRQKGKTFEERFGKERAERIKERISINSKGKNSGMFEERFGKERAIIEKQKRSIAQKGIPTGKNIDRFGKKKAKEISNKISLKKKIPKQLMIKRYQEMHDILGGFCKGEWDDYMFCNSETIRRRFGSLDELARQANKEFKKSQKGRFGKNETFILDKIEQDNNIILDRQKRIITDNKVYHIDGFDKENNVVYEVDERYHKFRKEYDILRDEEIKNKLGCEIVRIKEREFINNINQSTLGDFRGVSNV